MWSQFFHLYFHGGDLNPHGAKIINFFLMVFFLTFGGSMKNKFSTGIFQVEILFFMEFFFVLKNFLF
jgi:hypothetical protein